MADVIFMKLGGSLITDKTGVEVVRNNVLARLAIEIKQALQMKPGTKLVLGHGSGSFGHVAGAKFGTRQGVHTAEQWQGFAEVSRSASRLNEVVVAALMNAGVPALSLQPSASAICNNGQIRSLAVQPVRMALAAGLVPVIFGDVAFDTIRGGTIISTEEVMMFLASELHPVWLFLAGETPGVLDQYGNVVSLITESTLDEISSALGGSRGTDVTGGMAGKVRAMLDLVARQPQMKIRIFSGLEAGRVRDTLVTSDVTFGSVIKSTGDDNIGIMG